MEQENTGARLPEPWDTIGLLLRQYSGTSVVVGSAQYPVRAYLSEASARPVYTA